MSYIGHVFTINGCLLKVKSPSELSIVSFKLFAFVRGLGGRYDASISGYASGPPP